MRSVQLQTNLCVSPSCDLTSEVICRHCSQQYCQLCFMCHRKNILDDMQSISEQMSVNRRQGVTEVISFIDKQAKDAHDQAKKLVDDAIDRIIKASQNIYAYIENRRQAKLGRLDECLGKFDQDAEMLKSKLDEKIFLSADAMLDFRRKYAYNMFDTMMVPIKTVPTEEQRRNEKFFDDYRYYHELINLRQKWTFFQPALTTVYFPAKKDISLDKILTFLEYRHDRVLENFREHLSHSEDSKDLSLKPAEDLLQELSFLSRKQMLLKCENCYSINELTDEVKVDTQHSEQKTDSGHVDDDDDDYNYDHDDNDLISSYSSQSWQIEDGSEDDCDERFMKLSQSMKNLEKQFENDFRLFQREENKQTN